MDTTWTPTNEEQDLIKDAYTIEAAPDTELQAIHRESLGKFLNLANKPSIQDRIITILRENKIKLSDEQIRNGLNKLEPETVEDLIVLASEMEIPFKTFFDELVKQISA
jgi:hypothetical protein